MTQSEALNILTKIAEGKATQDELNTLASEIANGKFNFGSVGGEDISKGGFSYNMNALKNYQKELKVINDKLKEGLKNHKKGKEYTEEEQKIINECLGQYQELLRKREKRNQLDNFNNKQLREGLTLQELTVKKLTEWGEQMGINTDRLSKGISEIKKGLSDIKSGVLKFNESWGKVDNAVTQYTRSIGGSVSAMKELRKSTIDFMETRSIGMKYNTSMEELIKLQADYNKSIGRSITLTNDQKESFAAMKTVAGEQAAIDFTTKLENFGLNPDEAGKRMGEMFSKASKSGVAFEKYSKNFLDNIKLAQNYNFTNGLKGLDAMAKKATEVKLNMQQVASFAEKVSTLEGAMTAGANLSVLGGSFARFGNPLQMLYEGLNDMEGLQDRVINMFGDLGKWDFAKGQVDVSAYNKQRIRAAAQSMGMDYGEVMQMVNANARRNIVEGQLGGLGADIRNDKEVRELILNKAQLDENGKAFVTIDGERRDLNKITAADRKALQRENASDSDNIKEIATNTRSLKDFLEGFEKTKEAAAASVNEQFKIGEATKSLLDTVGEMPTLMKVIATAEPVTKLLGGIFATVNGIWLTMTMMKGGGGSIGTGSGSFGKLVNTGKAITRMKDLSAGQKFGAGLKAGAKFGKGSGIAAGVISGGLTAYDEFAGEGKDSHSTGEKVGSTTGSAVGGGLGAWGGAALGAAIGTAIFPGVGTAIGGLIGAGLGGWGGSELGNYLGGGIGNKISGGSWNSEKARQQKLEQLAGRGVTLNGTYTEQELDILLGGRTAVRGNRDLEAKLARFNDILPERYLNGGLTPGAPGEAVGIVDGHEYVMNSTDVDKIQQGNIIEPLGNMLNQLHVAKNNVSTNSTSSVGAGSLDLNINIGGKIDLEANGAAKTISGSDILTNDIIDSIIRKIQERTDYALNKDKTHIKFM